MRVDVRLAWSVVGQAAAGHAVCALVAMTAGFLLVPSVTVLVGMEASAQASLIAALVLHACVDAVFVAAMRRVHASVATCLLNLVLAHLPVVAVGVGLAVAGGEVTGLLVQAAYQTGRALLSVAVGTAGGLAWVRLRDGGA